MAELELGRHCEAEGCRQLGKGGWGWARLPPAGGAGRGAAVGAPRWELPLGVSPMLARGLAPVGFGVVTRDREASWLLVLVLVVGRYSQEEIVLLLGSVSERGVVKRNSQKDEKSCIMKNQISFFSC